MPSAVSRLFHLRRWRWWRRSPRCRCFGAAALVFLRSQDRVQRVAFLARAELHDTFFLDVLDQSLKDLSSQVGARHFTTAEEDGRLDLVAFIQKTQHVILFGFVVVVVHINAELHFLDYDLLLMLLGLALLFFLLVQEFPVVHDAADGRLRGGRDLNQVQIFLAGHLERFERRQDADLISFVVNHPDFAGAYAVVGADKPFIDNILRAVPAETRGKIIAWVLRDSACRSALSRRRISHCTRTFASLLACGICGFIGESQFLQQVECNILINTANLTAEVWTMVCT